VTQYYIYHLVAFVSMVHSSMPMCSIWWNRKWKENHL